MGSIRLGSDITSIALNASTLHALSIAFNPGSLPEAAVEAHEWAGIFCGQLLTPNEAVGVVQEILATSVEPPDSLGGSRFNSATSA